MAKAADQFKSSDVTFWGLAALASWALAVLAANVSGVIPVSSLAMLHASRIDGGTVIQLRAELAEVRQQSNQLRRENSLLLQRFDLAEQGRSDVTRRVGALEVSVPRLLERLPERVAIDGSVTASGVEGTPLTFEADGGSVRVQQRPLVPMRQPATPLDALATDNSAPSPAPRAGEFGVALGFPVEAEDANGQWQNLLANVGTLLIGMWPVTGEVEGGGGQVIIAGPIATSSAAETLCDRLTRVGIPCKPVPFAGDPLPLLN